MARKTVTIQTCLEEDTAARLREAAQADKRTVSEYLRLVIEEHLNG